MLESILDFFRGESTEFILFAAAFVSATLFPGGSEAVLVGAAAAQPEKSWLFLGVATLGNTLGGMTGYLLGRFIPEKKKEGRALAWLHRRGVWALLFSWLPLFGDALPVAAGWLRLNPWVSALFIAIGKGVRYGFLLAGLHVLT